MRTPRIFRTCLAAAISLLFWGCAGKGNDTAPRINDMGQHPKATWLNTHWSEYAKQPDQCITCHGSVKDPAKAGGVSQVSCFSCHPNGPGHPTGWAAGNQHGRLGAKAAAGDWSGLASCARCHGSDYLGGLAKVSCKSCHTKAPHADKPWRNLNPALSNHDGVDVSNAPECIKCHAAGSANNPAGYPATPPTPGATPGCYNNTMCHDRNP
jgi:hypothetical protein